MDRNVTAALLLAGVGVLGVAGLTVALDASEADTTPVAAQSAPVTSEEHSATTGQGNGWGQGNGLGNGQGGGYGGGQGNGQGANGTGDHGQGTQREAHAEDIPAAVPGAEISPEVEAQLVFMVQEEKLARDVYTLAMGEYPDARVFSNISRAESTHMSEVQVLLERYDVADPTKDLAPGVFVENSLKALYDSLADQVETGWAQAVQAGVAVEVTDIEDLEAALELEAPADVTAVLENLLAGSQRHLAAFQRNGGTVTNT